MSAHTAGKLNATWLADKKSEAASHSNSASIATDWTMMLFGTWLLSGVLMDGWAHNHLGDEIDSFFTPWHAILYSGYLACAIAHSVILFRRHRSGRSWLDSMPRGYGLSMLGVLIFGISGIGDLLWHEVFGIEVSVSAGFSPPHLGIMAGICLIVTGPLRSAWNRPVVAPQKWLNWLPALISIHSGLTLMSFVTQYAHPMVNLLADSVSPRDEIQALGAASILLQSAILMGWILFVLNRWRLPVGSMTFLFTLNAIAMCIMRDTFFLLPSAVLSGILSDLLLWKLAPSPARTVQFHLFAFAVPVIFYALYFAAVIYAKHISWPIPLWTGTTLMAGVVSLLISYLILPPKPPQPTAA